MPKRKRKSLTLTEKLAAALYEVQRLRGVGVFDGKGATAERALYTMRQKKAPAEDVLGMFVWDHNIYHADGGADEWYNLTPMLKHDHIEKTKKDVGIIFKGKRLRHKLTEHQQHLIDRAEMSRLTPESIASMPEAQFNRLMDNLTPEAANRLMGGDHIVQYIPPSEGVPTGVIRRKKVSLYAAKRQWPSRPFPKKAGGSRPARKRSTR